MNLGQAFAAAGEITVAVYRPIWLNGGGGVYPPSEPGGVYPPSEPGVLGTATVVLRDGGMLLGDALRCGVVTPEDMNADDWCVEGPVA